MDINSYNEFIGIYGHGSELQKAKYIKIYEGVSIYEGPSEYCIFPEN
jgi:hypothetical protein